MPPDTNHDLEQLLAQGEDLCRRGRHLYWSGLAATAYVHDAITRSEQLIADMQRRGLLR